MQIQQQPVDTWSDQEVSQALSHLSQIKDNTYTIAQHTADLHDWVYMVTDANAMLIFIMATALGYWLAAVYTPAMTALGRWQ